MVPATEDLIIILSGQWIADRIPVETIRIINERGDRSGSASFTIEDAGDLPITVWTSFAIIKAGASEVIFYGYITEANPIKVGIRIDYEIQAISRDSLLNKSFVNGTFSGDDADILAAMLAASFPDFSDLFDFSSNVSAISLSEFNFDINNLSLSDALSELADKVDADYFVSQGDAARINYMQNPALLPLS